MLRVNVRRLALLALLALAPAAQAQEAQPGKARIGLGISYNPVDSLLRPREGFTPVSVNVPIDLGAVRVEPSLGILSLDTDNSGKSSAVDLGVGVFFLMKSSKDFHVYAGPRLVLGFASAESAGGLKDSGVDVRLAAALGAEWFAAPSFSFGAEAQLGFQSIAKLQDGNALLRDGSTGFDTAGLAFLRFYL
ncbi:MAG TPA: outer membrane beta-barrel protein [Anaeromyxobacteraceae bacterium]|nr:outer membrane beta-barrel protein [Anaeromyxobacteraceae bacterium]